MIDLTTTAEETSRGLLGVVDEATAEADEEAADVALRLVASKTPRRTGRLAAGLRSAVVENGFEVVDDVPYAPVVDERTGFASETLLAAEDDLAAIYDRHLQERLDAVP